MRASRRVFSWLMVIAACSCGGNDDAGGPGPGGLADAGSTDAAIQDGADARGDGGDGGADSGVHPGPPPILPVTGIVVDALRQYVAGVPVTIVDALGTKRVVVTDTNGVFSAGQVAFPYDASVGAVGPSDGSSTYLGLTRTDPVLDGPLVSTGAVYRSGKLEFDLPTFACHDANGCPVRIQAYATGGSSSVYSRRTTEPPHMSIRYNWTGPDTHIPLSLRVLGSQSDDSEFYHSVTTVLATHDETVNAGALRALETIPATSWTVRLDSDTSTATWSPLISAVRLRFPNEEGTLILGAAVRASSVTVRVPKLTRLTLGASAALILNSSDRSESTSHEVAGYSVTTPATTIRLERGAEITSPVAGGHLGATGAFAFAPLHSPALYCLYLTGSNRTSKIYLTSGQVSVARLKELGVVLVPGSGDMMLESLRPLISTDALVAPPRGPNAHAFPQLARSRLSFTIDP